MEQLPKIRRKRSSIKGYVALYAGLAAIGLSAIMLGNEMSERSKKKPKKVEINMQFIPLCPKCNRKQPSPDKWEFRDEDRLTSNVKKKKGESGLFWCENCKESYRVENKRESL